MIFTYNLRKKIYFNMHDMKDLLLIFDFVFLLEEPQIGGGGS